MATGHQVTQRASNFCEIAHTARWQNGECIQPTEVTIFYKYKEERRVGGKWSLLFPINFHDLITPTHYTYVLFLSATKLEFEVQGGTLFEEERNGQQCRLTIVTSNGQKLDVFRDPGGGW